MGKKTQKKHVTNDFIITNYGTNEVTGSCVMVEIPNENIKLLFDYGLYQSNTKGVKDVYDINYKKLKVPLNEIDNILITHAHYDHTAGLGICMTEESGFKGKIMCTEASQPLISLNVRDSAFVMAQQCKLYNRANPKKRELLPLYTEEHAMQLANHLQGYGYGEEIAITQNVKVEFLPCGHLLGDGAILLTYMIDEYTTRKLLYTGDINPFCKSPRPFTKQWDDSRILDVDVLIMESTYSGRVHKEQDVVKELERVVLDQCVKNKRVLFLPVFSIGRSSQLVYYLKEVWDRNPQLNKVNLPIYLAGKMTNASHNIYSNTYYHEHFMDEQWQDADCFKWSNIHKIDKFCDVEEKLIDNKPKIILASSGMVAGGYAVYLAQQLITRENVVYMTSGYCGVGTHGRAILETKYKDKKEVQIQGAKYMVRCCIEEPLTLSGHGDEKQLVRLAHIGCNQNKLKKIILIHGDEDGKKHMKDLLEKVLDMDKKEIFIPKPNDTIKLFERRK